MNAIHAALHVSRLEYAFNEAVCELALALDYQARELAAPWFTRHLSVSVLEARRDRARAALRQARGVEVVE